MRPPCETFARDVLPAVRSLVAKDLIEGHGLIQTAAARKLGITQAAISYYLDAKRGGKALKQLEENPVVKKRVSELARGIVDGVFSEEEVAQRFCELCEQLRNHQ